MFVFFVVFVVVVVVVVVVLFCFGFFCLFVFSVLFFFIKKLSRNYNVTDGALWVNMCQNMRKVNHTLINALTALMGRSSLSVGLENGPERGLISFHP